jgi:hypothetical protein
MDTQFGFVVKVLLLSTAISIAIKYSDRFLAIKPTTTITLVIVLLPSSILAVLLAWKYSQLDS